MTLKNPLVTVALHWRQRPRLGYGVVVPTDRDPAACEWRWTRGLDVLLFRDGDAVERVANAARAIAAARPRRLVVLDITDRKTVSIVKPDEPRAVA